jgi:hypothetical protein
VFYGSEGVGLISFEIMMIMYTYVLKYHDILKCILRSSCLNENKYLLTRVMKVCFYGVPARRGKVLC